MMSTAEAIKRACETLMQSGRPITRRGIAELVGCSMRTVSKYRDAWEPCCMQSMTLLEAPKTLRSDDGSMRVRLSNIASHLQSAKSRRELVGLETSLSWLEERACSTSELRQEIRTLKTAIARRIETFDGETRAPETPSPKNP